MDTARLISASADRQNGTLRYAPLVAEHTRDSIVVTGVDRRIVWVNPAFERLTGYAFEEIVGKSPGSFLQGPETDPATVAEIGARLAERAPVKVEIVNYTKGGQPYWIEMDIIPVFDDEGRHTNFIALERDITDRKALFLGMEQSQATEARRRQERLVLTEMSEWLYSAETTQELWGIVEAAMSRLLGATRGTLFVYRNSRDRLEPVANWGREAPNSLTPTECWAMRRGRTHNLGFQVINVPCPHQPETDKAAACIPLLAHGETLGLLSLEFEDTALGPDGSVIVTDAAPAQADLEERRQLAHLCAKQIGLAIANVHLRAELRAQSTRDVLTGLPNRRKFLEDIRDAVAEAAEQETPLSLLSLDVDHFKSINDTYGHATGDIVLRALAGIANDVVAASGTVYRIGGEEFVVLMRGMTEPEAVETAERLREAVRARTGRKLGPAVPEITVSLGAAMLDRTRETAQELLERADQALYRAKREGRDRVVTA